MAGPERWRGSLTRRKVYNAVSTGMAALWPSNLLLLARNAGALARDEPWRDFMALHPELTVEGLAERAIAWIRRSQDRVGSGGVGDLGFGGWTPGYPEVTGYIIPTFWDYHHLLDRPELGERAIRMADWELRLQKPLGGYEGLYEGENQPPVVFNTGQVARGLIRTHAETGEQRYLDAAVRAGDWIVANQEPDGSWARANYLGMARTYDTYAAAALAQLAVATSDERYAHSALANCEFAISCQTSNGWFDRADNTGAHNEAPSTHTLCYTVEGLLETGRLLGEPRCAEAGERGAKALMGVVDEGGRLPGHLDRDWRSRSRSVVLTGAAQLGIILMNLHRERPNERLEATSSRLLDFLAFAQSLSGTRGDRAGGLPGSFPIWGRYIPLKHPSWATKFFLDHLRLVRIASQPAPRRPGRFPTEVARAAVRRDEARASR